MPGKQQFKPGDLVFAKMKGYPHWPARVCKLDEPHKKRLGVFFFGTHQIGHLLPENLIPFSGNKLKYGTGVRLKGFSEGMWEIQNTPGIGKKSTFAAKSPPAKPVATSKTTCAAAIPAAAVKSSPGGADANVAAVKTSSEAASRAGSTLLLKECVVKCGPAKTLHDHLSGANELASASQPASAVTASDSGTKSELVTKTLRRSSFRSSAQVQLEEKKIDTQTRQEASMVKGGVAGQTPGSTPRRRGWPQRRGRPRNIPAETKSDVLQAKESQTAPSGAHVTASTLRLKPCVVKCIPAKTPDTHKSASEPARPSAGTPAGDLATAQEASAPVVKRKPGRPRKIWREKSQVAVEPSKRTHDFPSPASANTPADSHGAAPAPKMADQAQPAATQTSGIDDGGKDERDAKMEKLTPGRRGGKRKKKEEAEQEGGEKGRTKMMPEVSTARRGGKKMRVDGEKQAGAEKGKAEVATEESTLSRGGKRKRKETKQEGELEKTLPSREGKKKVGGKEETEQKSDKEGKTATAEEAAAAEETTPSRRKRDDAQQEKIEAIAEETSPSQEDQAKAKEGKKEQTKREGKTEAMQSQPSRGGKRKEETEQKRSADARTEATAEEASGREGKTKRKAREDTKQMGGEEGKAVLTTHETAPRPGEKSKTKEARKEEAKRGGGERLAKTQGDPAPSQEDGTQTNQREENKRSGDEEAKTRATAEDSTLSSEEKTNEGKKEETKQLGDEEGKTKATTEESMPGRDGRTKRKEREEAKHTKVTTDEFRPSRGDQAKAKEGKKEESKEGKTKARTEESRSSHEEGEKEETKPTGGKEGKTERTATEESTLSREGKMKTRGYKEEEENKPVGGREGKTKVTSEESALCPGEKAKTKEGQKDVAKQTPGKEAKTTEESTVSRRGGQKDDDKQEGKTKATAEEEASRGDKRKRKEGQREKTKQEGGQKAKPELPAEESTPGPGGRKRQRRPVEKDQSKRLGHPGGKPEVTAAAGKSRPPEERRGKVTRADARRDARQGADRENCKSQSEPRMHQETRGEKKSRSRKAAAAMEQSDAAEEEQQRRRWRLAAKRESVLKSLRGLLKASRGAKRRDAGTKSFTKAAIRAKAKRPRGHTLKESNARKKMTQPPATASPPVAEHTNTTAKQSDGKVKDSRPPSEDELQKKDAKKLIGKIVKATTKVQVKTMMGGATVAPPEEEEEKAAATAANTERTADLSDEEERKPHRVWTEDEKDVAKAAGKRQRHEPPPHKDAKQQSGGRSRKANVHDNQRCDSGENHQQHKNNVNLTPTDSTLHRIHGDIRISLKSDNPDVAKCLAALDQLSGVYVTSQHVHRHSELISTLRKMRFYRANQDIMDKAAMLYNRFKNAFLLGEGEEVVSAAFLRSLLKEKEREEVQRCKKEKAAGGEKDDGCQAPSAD
ncbi:enolase-phosphatase E1-like isoform X6 [Syngnathus acus]|uniref:enolase-phosphatase E1-like isoform X6 n=1 Tax=Syngnathus acus TaxID=161584 RepID=UPI0018864E54|nr:enolase-phosphatase E1-like isoform X6 [Syngnathus acus]